MLFGVGLILENILKRAIKHKSRNKIRKYCNHLGDLKVIDSHAGEGTLSKNVQRSEFALEKPLSLLGKIPFLKGLREEKSN